MILTRAIQINTITHTNIYTKTINIYQHKPKRVHADNIGTQKLLQETKPHADAHKNVQRMMSM